ncbi:hypothetical protein SB783_34885 [Paraburkholderia sp. SIMBA_009]|uniref:Uncharacterized protein n=1 Tax=Paraburkholderia tropica TaxID=92647 RepID=A0AAQ1GMN0_9BURK|nr:hypothetical protein [Paraburkholderia tropica]PXX05677.1 hypothetical protein C7400_14050 [Paraburkholderia tropica]PZW70799.1 hypothetical protein C7399_14050 [Paraburkholderia tropica]RQN37267.1 hypothetical protein EHZ25_20165 [Paraburkholderia tropica]SEK13007.1 hypothetical protein SAMN05216550_12356 [Paraburkholderia tropica]
MYSLLECVPIIVVPSLIAWIAIRLASAFHVTWIAYVAFGAVIFMCVAFALLDRWRKRRAAQRVITEPETAAEYRRAKERGSDA